MHARISPTVPHGAVRNACYLHGGGQRNGERFIDTGVHIEGEGFLAICEGCIVYLGKLLGMFSPADVQALTDELRDSNDARVEQAQKLVEMRSHNEALRVLLGQYLEQIPEAPAEPAAPVDPVSAGLAVLDEIKAEAAAREEQFVERYGVATPEWREDDTADAAIERERAEVGE